MGGGEEREEGEEGERWEGEGREGGEGGWGGVRGGGKRVEKEWGGGRRRKRPRRASQYFLLPPPSQPLSLSHPLPSPSHHPPSPPHTHPLSSPPSTPLFCLLLPSDSFQHIHCGSKSGFNTRFLILFLPQPLPLSTLSSHHTHPSLRHAPISFFQCGCVSVCLYVQQPPHEEIFPIRAA